MDGLLNKGKAMMNNAGNNQGGAVQGGAAPQQGGNAGQEDYGDKGEDTPLFFSFLLLRYTVLSFCSLS